jgi:RNA polymerase primary sigma factor
MVHGSHGSLERTPGALFRAMGALFLLKEPDRSREGLARELQEHLRTLGVEYHVRTLKRQLAGSVSSVPPEVQAAMRHVLLRVNGLRTDLDIEKALGAVGLWVDPEERQPEYLSTERIVPLAQLWLLFNPNHSGRSLAASLCKRLAHRGVQCTIDPLQGILAGRQSLARREVHEALLALLSAYGIASEAEALVRWQQHQKDIAAYLRDRALEPADRLVDLARAWKLRNHQPSSRHLAVILQHRLRKRGLDLGLARIQEALDGKAKHVRRALIVEMEDLLREALPEGRDLANEVAAAAQPTRQTDLCWVKAEPISALAKGWLRQHPSATMRQLSIRVAKSALRRGYATSPITVQKIIGGHAKRTRGFVYSAMLRQIPDSGDHIPEEHIVSSHRAERAIARGSRLPAQRRPSSERAKRSGSDSAVSIADSLAAHSRGASGVLLPSPEAQVELADTPRPIRRSRPDRAQGDAVSMYLEAAGREPLLTKEEEVELAIRIERGRGAEAKLQSGRLRSKTSIGKAKETALRGNEARRRFILANLRLVVSVARRYQGQGLPFLDLVQEGNIGLMHALDLFDWSRGFKFSTYATWWIRQAVIRAIADRGRQIRVPVHVHDKIRILSRIRAEFDQTRGREAAPQELAKRMGLRIEEVERLIEVELGEPLSLQLPVGENTELGDLLADEQSLPDVVEDAMLREEIGRAVMNELDPRERRVLVLRYGLGNGHAMSFRDVGKIIGLSGERVRLIEREALQKLRESEIISAAGWN